MAGGLLNLIAVGNQNVIIHGDPQKTFFKVTYAKHTNFGLQKFRIDYDGYKTLNATNETKYTFKVPRYGDLLMDTFFVVKMPTIWSPIVLDRPVVAVAATTTTAKVDASKELFSYEFKWIKDLGAQMIKEVTITIGGQVIQRFSGDYIRCMVERDYSHDQKELFNKMTGNVPAMHSPEQMYADKHFQYPSYPNTVYKVDSKNDHIIPTPSIDGRYLYIPLNAFWCLNSKMSLPLLGLEYSEVKIEIVIRPLKELYTIINTEQKMDGTYVDNQVEEVETAIFTGVKSNKYVRAAPDYTNNDEQLRIFLYPTDRTHKELIHEVNFDTTAAKKWNFLADGTGEWTPAQQSSWNAKREDWNCDVHLISTYAFLSEDESDVFVNSTQEYLFKDVKEHKFLGVHGAKQVELETSALVSGWMYHLQRDDVKKRNEWSNYTNGTYNSSVDKIRYLTASEIGYGNNTGNNTGINKWNGGIFSKQPDITAVFYERPMVTNSFNTKATTTILNDMGIIFDGKYRENIFDSGIYSYLEILKSVGGPSVDGLFCYNFSLNTSPFEVQPSGAINLSKFNKIEFEFTTIEPELNQSFNVQAVCAPGGITGILEKGTLFNYSYDLTVYEERYNIIEFKNGMVSLKFTR